MGRAVWLVCLILHVPVPLHVHVTVGVTQGYNCNFLGVCPHVSWELGGPEFKGMELGI